MKITKTAYISNTLKRIKEKAKTKRSVKPFLNKTEKLPIKKLLIYAAVLLLCAAYLTFMKGRSAMPKIFLSPSLQEWNPYVDGGNEEYYMNLIADAMEPYLRASNIDFDRNSPQQTLTQAIEQSNKGNYDLHFAIHSNAAPENLAGKLSGADFYYFPTSNKGMEAATVISDNYKNVYPNPSNVEIIPTTTLAEVKRTKAPAVLAEIAYHDNPVQAQWIRDNINEIARNLSEGIALYLGVPFVEPE